MKKQFLYLSLGFFLFASLISATELLSAPYYEGKVINMVVGSPPGGSNDQTARFLARHLPKFIPGKPTIIVENMPAGVSMAAANYLYNVAKRDGLTIGLIGKHLVFQQLLKVEAVKFDLTKYSWLGSAMVEGTLLAIRSDLPYKTIQELQKAKQPIFFAGTGAGSFGDQWSTMLIEFLGLNAKIVANRGTTEQMLALERKEADAGVLAYSAAWPHVDRGLVRPLVRTRISSERTKDLPNAEDLIDNKIGKTVMAMLALTGETAKPFLVPPGTPADVLNILRDAFVKTLRDPKVVAESEKAKLDVSYVSPEDCLKIIKYILNQPPEIVKEFNKYVNF